MLALWSMGNVNPGNKQFTHSRLSWSGNNKQGQAGNCESICWFQPLTMLTGWKQCNHLWPPRTPRIGQATGWHQHRVGVLMGWCSQIELNFLKCYPAQSYAPTKPYAQPKQVHTAEYLNSVPLRKLDFNRKLHALHDKESSKDILASIVKTGLGLIKLIVR
jgi:hypothetical protein